jgi:hypothetical protein
MWTAPGSPERLADRIPRETARPGLEGVDARARRPAVFRTGLRGTPARSGDESRVRPEGDLDLVCVKDEGNERSDALVRLG